MEITEADFLTIGVMCEDGNEPDEFEGYKRARVRLRWDPSSDEEVYVNVDRVLFPMSPCGWGRLVGFGIFAGNARIASAPLRVPALVPTAGYYVAFEARTVRLPRADLVNRYGDRRRTFVSYGNDHRLPFEGVGLRPRDLDCTTYDLEWPRRPRREDSGELFGIDKAQEFAREYQGEWKTRGYDQAAREYWDRGPRLAYEELRRAIITGDFSQFDALNRDVANGMAMARALEALDRGEGKPLDAAERWIAGTLSDKLHAAAMEYAMEEALKRRRVAEGRQHIGPIPLPKPVSKPEERKIVVPVPRFWGQLDQALNAPKKAAPPKEMPTVEPTPAGAEELIDWARAHEDKVAWAEKLSIPRVTRMLKEMSNYGKRWAESDLVALAG
jgi:hypothetical protein